MRITWLGSTAPVALVGVGMLDPDEVNEVPDEIAQRLIDEGRAVSAEPPGKKPKQPPVEEPVAPAEQPTETPAEGKA